MTEKTPKQKARAAAQQAMAVAGAQGYLSVEEAREVLDLIDAIPEGGEEAARIATNIASNIHKVYNCPSPQPPEGCEAAAVDAISAIVQAAKGEK